MDAAAIEEHLAGMEGVRARTDRGRTTWRVGGRLVARLEDAVRRVLTAAWELQER